MFKFKQSIRDEPEIYNNKLLLPHFQHLQQRAASWNFPQPTLPRGWGNIKHTPFFLMTAKSYLHPRLAMAKVGFVTYADHMRVVEASEVANARRAAREIELQEEDEYLHNRNERLRVIVVPEGREHL
jgi:hypothetical protein